LSVDCLDDKVQNAFQSQYEYFKANRAFGQYLMIAFGVLTDALLLIFLAKWVYQGGSWRFLIALFLTYSLRLVNTSLFKIRLPPGGDIWGFPGFYSMVVQYGSNNDYYFNPALAVCIQLVLEFKYLKQKTLMCLSILALIGDCYLSLCFKGHYSIDNFGGLILGAYIWICSNYWLSYYVDVKLFGMTLHERFPDQIQTECSNCGESINKWCQVKELKQ